MLRRESEYCRGGQRKIDPEDATSIFVEFVSSLP